jgi:TetR/AcrR family transcriptional regulator, cholesterol catabolism regulator
MLNSQARQRVLDAAERLFGERGYAAVTLNDIASAVGIRHASLYHHVPGGKQELFIEVTERSLHRHANGLHQAIDGAQPDVRSRLYAVARWLLSQPPMDLVRMVHSDMPAIDPESAMRLSLLALEAMIEPVSRLLHEAQANGEVDHTDLGVIAGGLVGMIESLHSVPPNVPISRESMALTLIDVMMDGMIKR